MGDGNDITTTTSKNISNIDIDGIEREEEKQSILPLSITICIVIIMCFIRIAATTAFSCIHLLVNKSVESKDVGKMNGFGQTVNSGSKALGPLIVSIVFAHSITNN